jgi:hypothetical protein
MVRNEEVDEDREMERMGRWEDGLGEIGRATKSKQMIY